MSVSQMISYCSTKNTIYVMSVSQRISYCSTKNTIYVMSVSQRISYCSTKNTIYVMSVSQMTMCSVCSSYNPIHSSSFMTYQQIYSFSLPLWFLHTFLAQKLSQNIYRYFLSSKQKRSSSFFPQIIYSLKLMFFFHNSPFKKEVAVIVPSNKFPQMEK